MVFSKKERSPLKINILNPTFKNEGFGRLFFPSHFGLLFLGSRRAFWGEDIHHLHHLVLLFKGEVAYLSFENSAPLQRSWHKKPKKKVENVEDQHFSVSCFHHHFILLPIPKKEHIQILADSHPYVIYIYIYTCITILPPYGANM